MANDILVSTLSFQDVLLYQISLLSISLCISLPPSPFVWDSIYYVEIIIKKNPFSIELYIVWYSQ